MTEVIGRSELRAGRPFPGLVADRGETDKNCQQASQNLPAGQARDRHANRLTVTGVWQHRENKDGLAANS